MSDEQKPQENQGSTGPQPVFLLPSVVTALCGLVVAVHLARSFAFNDEGDMQFTLWFAFIPIRLIAGGQIDGGWLPLLWTPFTHAFLHAGWDHLLLNVAWLAIFGTPVARRYGAGATVILFLASSAAGALAFAATTLPGFQLLLGAAGGVAGLTGAACRFVFQPVIVARDPESGEPRVLGRRMASLMDLARHGRARFFILVWVVLNAAVPLLPLLTGQDIQVAWQAHLGGFFAGLLLAPLFEQKPKEIAA